MANAIKVASIIAKESLAILNNQLGLISSFHRDLESEFNKNVNGYKIGDRITMRRPADFTVRQGAVRVAQDIVEGGVELIVDKQIGVDFDLTSKELTLDIEDRAGVNGLRERVVKPAITNLVNDLLGDVMTIAYQGAYNWVGTPGQQINSFQDYSKMPERLDEMATPQAERYSTLSPNDHWGLLGSATGMFVNDVAKTAYREARLGMLGGVDTYMSQLVPWHTVGPLGGTPIINGGTQSVLYSAVKDTWAQSLITDGWTAAAAARVKKGDVFTLAGVFMVNAKTKISTGILQQFVVNADGSSDGAGNLTMNISPPIIITGPHQTVNAAPIDGAALTFVGTANTAYRQNLAYHKNSIGLAVIPMVIPPGSVDFARETSNGLSIRVGPVYDGTNDVSGWRMDMLYGRKLLDPRIITRGSGTA